MPAELKQQVREQATYVMQNCMQTETINRQHVMHAELTELPGNILPVVSVLHNMLPVVSVLHNMLPVVSVLHNMLPVCNMLPVVVSVPHIVCMLPCKC